MVMTTVRLVVGAFCCHNMVSTIMLCMNLTQLLFCDLKLLQRLVDASH